MDISFVILTWNSEKYITKCLDLLLNELINCNFLYEIFVVDNGSEDNTPHLLKLYRERFPQNIFPIFLKRNYGTTLPRNIALKKTNGDILIIMDSDVETLEGTIEKLVEFVKREKNVGIVAPRLFYPDGKLQKSTDVFPTICNKTHRFFFLKRIEKIKNEVYQDEQITEVDYAISAMWVFRKELIKKVGLLDEKIFYAPEDVDYCLRVWKSGFKVMYLPEAKCIHHTQEVSRGIRINVHKIHHILGLLYYFKKHGYFFKKPSYTNKD